MHTYIHFGAPRHDFVAEAGDLKTIAALLELDNGDIGQSNLVHRRESRHLWSVRILMIMTTMMMMMLSPLLLLLMMIMTRNTAATTVINDQAKAIH
jgi:hypothetical protein